MRTVRNVRQRRSRSEWKRCLTTRRGGKTKRQTERGEDNLLRVSLDVFRASTIPQPADRLCAHYSTESSGQSENGETERDPRRDVYSLGCALLHPTLPVAAGRTGWGGCTLWSPVLCTPLSARTRSRISLSVDVPQGLDTTGQVYNQTGPMVGANQYYMLD